MKGHVSSFGWGSESEWTNTSDDHGGGQMVRVVKIPSEMLTTFYVFAYTWRWKRVGPLQNEILTAPMIENTGDFSFFRLRLIVRRSAYFVQGCSAPCVMSHSDNVTLGDGQKARTLKCWIGLGTYWAHTANLLCKRGFLFRTFPAFRLLSFSLLRMHAESYEGNHFLLATVQMIKGDAGFNKYQ